MSNFQKNIEIRGARVNNLKNLDVDIPLKKITCIVGPSGSGKSSLAFHTLLAESKRRLLNCFPSAVKFFTKSPPAVDVDSLSPVLPVFGLPQINPIKGSRESVTDSLGLTHLIQGLFYYLSKEYCPDHKIEYEFLDSYEVFKSQYKHQSKDSKQVFHFFITKTQYLETFQGEILPSRVFHEGEMKPFDKDARYWEVFRIKEEKLSDQLSKKIKNLKESFERIYFINSLESSELKVLKLPKNKSCPKCLKESKYKKSSNLFTPYNAYGACKSCSGFGANLVLDKNKLIDKDKTIHDGAMIAFNIPRFSEYEDEFLLAAKKEKISFSKKASLIEDKIWDVFYNGTKPWKGFKKIEAFLERKKYKPGIRVLLRKIQKELECEECNGSRVTKKSYTYKLQDMVSIDDVYQWSLDQLSTYIQSLKIDKSNRSLKLVIEGITKILETSIGIGLGHLGLKRKSKTLSAGEYQRVLLVKYLSFEGTDSLFVFDEPSLGLDLEQQKLLMKGLEKIKKQGNTIVLVDHSVFMAKSSDKVLSMGPAAGHRGGEILKNNFIEKKAKLPKIKKLKSIKDFIKVGKVEIYGKKYTPFKIPINALVWVNGATGSGKSSVIKNVVYNQIHYQISKEYHSDVQGNVDFVDFKKDTISSLLLVDANLNRYTSRSTVGSLTELAKPVRLHFSKLPISKAMGLGEGHFSSNSQSGKCPKCEGRGHEIIEMPYLEDVFITCEECEGKKIKIEHAMISDGKKTAHEAFSNPVSEVLDSIEMTPKYHRTWEYLKKLKLDYLALNRQLTSLSGGEKQRMYLLSKIIKRSDNRLIIIENLSFGLSKHELIDILAFLKELTSRNQTILILDRTGEYYKDICDWEISFNSNGKIVSKSL